jgi:hypothetical protein
VDLIIPVIPNVLMAANSAAPAVMASAGVAKAGEPMRVANAMAIASFFISNLGFLTCEAGVARPSMEFD